MVARPPRLLRRTALLVGVRRLGVVFEQPGVVVGTALNAVVLAVVTVMTERRMLGVAERSEAYRDYQRRTSVWLPGPPR